MMLFDYPVLQAAEEGVLIAGMLGGDAMHPVRFSVSWPVDFDE